MDIKLLKQTRKTNCGQTCVAMLTGKSVAEVEKAFGCGGATYISRHAAVLDQLGCVAGKPQRLAKDAKLPDIAIVLIGYLKRSGGKFSVNGKTKRCGHFVVWANGQFYNPSGYTMEALPVGQVISYVLEVLVP